MKEEEKTSFADVVGNPSAQQISSSVRKSKIKILGDFLSHKAVRLRTSTFSLWIEMTTILKEFSIP